MHNVQAFMHKFLQIILTLYHKTFKMYELGTVYGGKHEGKYN